MESQQFEQYRSHLFGLAYRMLGSAADAEDVVQETFLRAHTRAADAIVSPKHYLATIATRLCLNQLNAARSRREQYLGPWLPEPIPTDPYPTATAAEGDPMATALQHDSLSIAFLVLLEALSPAERAVFLLHEVFAYKFAEIGEMLDKSAAACRQLNRRAKEHLAANRPRYTATPAEHHHLLNSFIQAACSGDVEAFLVLLAEDVTFVPDGGGERGAAIRVLHGRIHVGAFIQGAQRIAGQNISYAVTSLNGQDAILCRKADGRPFFAVFVYGGAERADLIYVIAGRKLAALV